MNARDRKAFDRERVVNSPAIRAHMNRGDWLIIGALALIWGSAFLLIRLAVAEVPPRPPVDSRLPSLQALAAIAGLALACSAFAYLLYFRLIATPGAANAMLVTLLAPPVAMLLGALVLGERLGVEAFLGLALIALGLAAIDGRLLSLLERRPPRPAA